jgi:transposase-like protein
MTMQRRQQSGEFKAQVVLEALRGERTLNAMAAHDGVHPLQMTPWQKVA